jgi:hypothetical protein
MRVTLSVVPLTKNVNKLTKSHKDPDRSFGQPQSAAMMVLRCSKAMSIIPLNKPADLTNHAILGDGSPQELFGISAQDTFPMAWFILSMEKETRRPSTLPPLSLACQSETRNRQASLVIGPLISFSHPTNVLPILIGSQAAAKRQMSILVMFSSFSMD